MSWKPWEDDGYSHETFERSDGLIECARCGKMGTSERKLSKTVCE